MAKSNSFLIKKRLRIVLQHITLNWNVNMSSTASISTLTIPVYQNFINEIEITFIFYQIFYYSIASLSKLITKLLGTAKIKAFVKNSNYFKLVSTNFSNNTNASILFEVQVQHHGHAITFLFAAVTSLLGLSKCKILLLCIFATW